MCAQLQHVRCDPSGPTPPRSKQAAWVWGSCLVDDVGDSCGEDEQRHLRGLERVDDGAHLQTCKHGPRQIASLKIDPSNSPMLRLESSTLKLQSENSSK